MDFFFRWKTLKKFIHQNGNCFNLVCATIFKCFSNRLLIFLNANDRKFKLNWQNQIVFSLVYFISIFLFSFFKEKIYNYKQLMRAKEIQINNNDNWKKNLQRNIGPKWEHSIDDP